MSTVFHFAHALSTAFLGVLLLALMATTPLEPPAPPALPTDALVLYSDDRTGFIQLDAEVPGIWVTSNGRRSRVLTEADLYRVRPGGPGRPIGAAAE